jgi:hypothetical protein
LDANGDLIGGPATLVEYVGTGKGSVVGLTAGPDGLYFTELYKDQDYVTPIDAGARVFRVRYVNPNAGDYDINGVVDENDFLTWRANYGSQQLLASDGNGNGTVDAADYTVWRDSLTAASAGSGAGTAAASTAVAAAISTTATTSASSSSVATSSVAAESQEATPRAQPAVTMIAPPVSSNGVQIFREARFEGLASATSDLHRRRDLAILATVDATEFDSESRTAWRESLGELARDRADDRSSRPHAKLAAVADLLFDELELANLDSDCLASF